MSVSELMKDIPHKWANLRVNNMTVDGILTAPDFGGEYYEMDQVYSGNLWVPSAFRKTRFYKIGNNVTMHVEGCIAQGSSSGTQVVFINNMPERFIPHLITGNNLEIYSIPISCYTANGYVDSNFFINSGGGCFIRFINSPGAIMCGFDTMSFSWNTSFD